MSRPYQGFSSVVGYTVALGVLAEAAEILVETDQAEVEYVNAVAEVMESELGPGSAYRLDGSLACCLAEFVLIPLVDRGGIADGCPATASQLLDRGPGEEGAQAEAPPLRGEAYGVEDQETAAHGFEQLIELGVETAAARAEDGLGNQAEVGFLAIQQAEGVAGVVDVDCDDVRVADMGDDVGPAVAAETCQVSGGGVGVEPPQVTMLVGERDVVWVGRRDAARSIGHEAACRWWAGLAWISILALSAKLGRGLQHSGLARPASHRIPGMPR